MKNKFKMMNRNWQLLILATAISVSATAQAPVSWTQYYEVGDNSFPPPATVNLKSIAYNPVNNHIYAYGPKLFNLPAEPSGHTFTKELGVVRYDNLTSNILGSVFDIHHDGTTLIPHSDEAGEMVIANDGSIYVTGKRYFDDTYLYDMIVIKYSSDLVEQWRYYAFSPGAADDAGIAIAMVPGSGNIVATGQVGDRGLGTGADYVTVELTPAGGVAWYRAYNSSGSQADMPADVYADASGNVYVTGNSVSTVKGSQYITIKYNSAGTRQWTKYYNGVSTAASDDLSNSVVADNSGKVFVTGTATNTAGNSDIATVAYDAAGIQLWVRKINNPGDSRDRGYVLRLDAAGNIYVGGDVDRDATSAINGDIIYRKYDGVGNTLLTKRFNGSLYNCEFGDMAVTTGGKVYLTGWCRGAVMPPAAGDYSYLTVKYGAAGGLNWSDFMTPSDVGIGTGFYGFKLAVNTSTSEVATGGRYWLWGPGAHPNQWLVRRYNPTSREAGELTGTAGSLSINIYPNPAADHFTIEMNSETADITIIDMKGQIVYEAKATGSTINMNSEGWARGIYSVIVRSDGNVINKKIVKD